MSHLPRTILQPRTMRRFPVLGLIALSASALPAQRTAADSALVARAKTFELNTPYVPPPGNALSLHSAALATITCSAVFVSGLDSAFAVNNLGGFTSPLAVRSKLARPVIDHARREVHVALPNGSRRTARFVGSQGCVTLPEDGSGLHFTPIPVRSALPAPSTQPWPMGDALPSTPFPREVDEQKVMDAVKAAFDSGMT
ncbi:MAG TPA: hypothetical protein VF483_03815, partial [Gemmatimonadaceae bacterium]